MEEFTTIRMRTTTRDYLEELRAQEPYEEVKTIEDFILKIAKEYNKKK